jgi:hypothetical protein
MTAAEKFNSVTSITKGLALTLAFGATAAGGFFA